MVTTVIGAFNFFIILCFVDYQLAVRTPSTRPHTPSHIHQHIIQPHLTHKLPHNILKAPSQAALPEKPLKRRVSRLHSPPPTIAGETSPRLIPQLPDPTHSQPPPRGTRIEPAVPPGLDHRLDLPTLQETIRLPRVIGTVPKNPGHPDIPPRSLNEPGEGPRRRRRRGKGPRRRPRHILI